MKITISHILYGQYSMLPLHQAAWQSHPEGAVRYTLIDDNSPVPIQWQFHRPHVDVFRILDKIDWNTSGARNLAFTVAETSWVLCADIDHVVTTEALGRIVQLDLNDPNVAYTFARRAPNGAIGCMYTHNILMNRSRFFEIGGNDEDFAGHYAVEDTFLGHCLRRHRVQIVPCEDIFLDWRPKTGATRGLSRDKTFNRALFAEKASQMERGEYTNGPILRFNWCRTNSPFRA